MDIRRTIRWMVFVAFLAIPNAGGFAQNPYTPYRPSMPTFSPWMNIFNRNTGPYDNYHSFVQPELNLQQDLRNQAYFNQQQNAAMGTMHNQMTRIEAERNRPMTPTGTASTFMNYSHYYPLQTSGGRPAKASNSYQIPSPTFSSF